MLNNITAVLHCYATRDQHRTCEDGCNANGVTHTQFDLAVSKFIDRATAKRGQYLSAGSSTLIDISYIIP